LAIRKSVDCARGNVYCLRTELRHARSSGPLNAYIGPGTGWRSRLNRLKLSQPRRELQNSLKAWGRIRTAPILRRAISNWGWLALSGVGWPYFDNSARLDLFRASREGTLCASLIPARVPVPRRTGNRPLKQQGRPSYRAPLLMSTFWVFMTSI
jgi:hypothetical protein